MKSLEFSKAIARDSGIVVGVFCCYECFHTAAKKKISSKKKKINQMGLLREFATEITEIVLMWTNLGAIIWFIWTGQHYCALDGY